MKDINFMEISSETYHPLVQFTQKQKEHLVKLIELDSQFLKNQKIMDYSLLLVIEQNAESEGVLIDENNQESIVSERVEIEKQIANTFHNMFNQNDSTDSSRDSSARERNRFSNKINGTRIGQN